MVGDLVSVVVPAYNAERTLDETLRSVRAQTHAELDILIVDDGSRDSTPALMRAHAEDDARVRLIFQENAGVAAARNAGWREARSDVIAFVDADDLWAPTKIERQLAALRAGGPRVGLVYCWYELIDEASAVASRWQGPTIAGDVLDFLLTNNFIGNGSSAMLTRAALEAANGFEPALRNAGAQGCEDYLLYCRVAEKFEFAVAPEFLVGYRYTPDNMSSDLTRMLRSWIMAQNELSVRHPDKRCFMHKGNRHYGRWLIRQAIAVNRREFIWPLIQTMGGHDSDVAWRMALRDFPAALLQHAKQRFRR